MTCEYRSIAMNCGTRTDAVLAHAADVVPAQVDEHDVLGALFLVALEFLGEPEVVLLAPAARSRPGDRVRLDAAALDPDEHLW